MAPINPNPGNLEITRTLPADLQTLHKRIIFSFGAPEEFFYNEWEAAIFDQNQPAILGFLVAEKQTYDSLERLEPILAECISFFSIDALRFAIELGADIDRPSSTGAILTAFEQALNHNLSIETILLLLKSGSKPATDVFVRLAEWWTTEDGPKIVNMLLEQGHELENFAIAEFLRCPIVKRNGKYRYELSDAKLWKRRLAESWIDKVASSSYLIAALLSGPHSQEQLNKLLERTPRPFEDLSLEWHDGDVYSISPNFDSLFDSEDSSLDSSDLFGEQWSLQELGSTYSILEIALLSGNFLSFGTILSVLSDAERRQLLPRTLQCACCILRDSDHKIISNILNAAPLDPRLIDRSGNTPLTMAVKRNYINWIPHLVRAGWSPNQANRDGTTPFLYSVVHSSLEMISSLIYSGADLRSSTGMNENILHLANSRKSLAKEVLDLLVEHLEKNGLLEDLLIQESVYGERPRR